MKDAEINDVELKDIMYLGLGTAIPSDKNIDYIQGVNHALLIFTLAADFEKANALAVEHLNATGWQEVIIDKMNPVDINAIQDAQA